MNLIIFLCRLVFYILIILDVFTGGDDGGLEFDLDEIDLSAWDNATVRYCLISELSQAGR